ncbi:MAG: PAS domain S-box protein [Muricauda sp.]|nr:PAS domain S-box protein [Allomuricauda sp.]MBA4746887.1 PAS domain S-box protein [Allomuricauda sp.]
MFPNRYASNPLEDIVFECCPNPMWIYDVNSLKFLRVNKEAVRCYGYTEKEFLAMTLEDIRPKGDVLKLVAAIDHIENRSGAFKEGYFRHRKKDGAVFPVQLKGSLISYFGRKAELVTAIDISDSTDCKRQQYYHKRLFQCITDINNNLIRNENWLEALDACFSILCENLKINRAYFLQSDVLDDSITLRLYKVRQVRSDGDMGLCKEYLPFPLLKLLLGPIRKGRKLKKNFSALKDTSEKDVFKSRQIKSLFAIPVIVHKKVRGVIGLEDCHEEREWTGEEQQVLHVLASNLSHLINQSDSLDKLRTSEKKFRSLVQNGTDFISILNVNGTYAYASPTYKSHLGYEPDSLFGTNYFDHVHTSDISKVEKAFKKSLGRDNMAMSLYRFKGSTGKWKWMEAIITNRLSDPNIQGIVVNKADVTDEVSQKIRKELVLSISKRLGMSSTLEDLLVYAQEEIGKITNCLASEIWIKSKDETVLHLNSSYFQKKDGNIFLGMEETPGHFEMGQGLPGKVWSSQKLMIWDRIQLMEQREQFQPN